MSDSASGNEEADVAGRPLFQVLHSTGNPWLESLLPAVLGVTSTASYRTVFLGSSFAVSAERIVTARHVATALDECWQHTRNEPIENRALAAALYLPESLLIQIEAVDLFDRDNNVAPDLALAQLALPPKENTDLRRMQFLKLSSQPITEGDEVTFVGFAHAEDSAAMIGGAEVFTSEGQLLAVTTVVAEICERIPHIPAPVFRMDCRMQGGMSGGPIFRRGTNEVVGVCARGLNGVEGNDYCYGSIIHPYLPWLTQP